MFLHHTSLNWKKDDGVIISRSTIIRYSDRPAGTSPAWRGDRPAGFFYFWRSHNPAKRTDTIDRRTVAFSRNGAPYHLLRRLFFYPNYLCTEVHFFEIVWLNVHDRSQDN